ncbi:hypothetical protein HY256_10435, partial [Candidatus Sumerlaeota bacterium]|nr:hypothetical protein [Candidatus Sumerlaeota bacterium]
CDIVPLDGSAIRKGPKFERGDYIVAFDSGATTITLSETARIVIGNPDDPAGGEDWDSTDPYTAVGKFLFDGFSFDSDDAAAILLKRANMALGGLRLESCRFKGLGAIETSADPAIGYSTGLRVEIAHCEFLPGVADAFEFGISLSNRPRGGTARAACVITNNVFNSPPLIEQPDPASRPLYDVPIMLAGGYERALVRGNVFVNCAAPVTISNTDHLDLAAEGNFIRFNHDSSSGGLGFATGFLLIGSDHNAIDLGQNVIRIEDANGASAGSSGVYGAFIDDEDNVIRSRGNDFEVFGGAAPAAFAESGFTQPYTLETTDDIWTTETMSVGTLTIGMSGKRRFSEVEMTQATVNDALALPSKTPGGILFLDSNHRVAEDNASFHYDAANGGINVGSNDGAEFTQGGAAVVYRIGARDEGAGAAAALESNGDLAASMLYLNKSGGSSGAKTEVPEGTAIGGIAALGHDGTDYEPAASILFTAGEAGPDLVPADVRISATPFGEAMTVHSNGDIKTGTNLGVGTDEFGTDAANVLAIAEGTTPTSSPAGVVQLYAQSVGGTAELEVRDGAGNITTLSPHRFTLFKPDPSLPLPFSFYSRNPNIGKEINVDLAGAIAEIERLSGKKFIYVRILPPGERENQNGKLSTKTQRRHDETRRGKEAEKGNRREMEKE